jgi:hypothetical protein
MLSHYKDRLLMRLVEKKIVLRTIRSWSMGIGIAFPVGKAARARSWSLTLSSAQVENDWSYTSTRMTWREQEKYYLIWLATFLAPSAYKVKFVFFFPSHEEIWRSEDINPCILSLALHDGEWSVLLPAALSPENNTRCPLDKRQSGHQSWSGRFREIKNLLVCRESNHDSLDL